MADDWQIGDLALCVKNGQWYDADGGCEHYGIPIRSGMVLSVRRVGQAIGHPCKALWLEGVEDRVSPAGFGSIRFRKIRPLTDEEREAFEADLRVPGHDLPTHTPQAPAREVVALPARSETHTPLQGRAGSFDFAAHTQPNAL